ncbi:MAG TPA: phosphoenolpyruvate--protein phosphotransferase [Bacteroidota bacterium]|nr:phosphoenolpyruvate--protein phosphotransferase [Bacteroidota bacterium]
MNAHEEIVLHGIAAAPGIVMGPAYVFEKHVPRIEEKTIALEDLGREIDRLKAAVARSEKELQKILSLAQQKMGDNKAKVFEAQIMILNDPILFDSICERIEAERKNAEFILHGEIAKYQQMMLASQDEYMRERVHDVEDVKNRVIRNIQHEKIFSRFDDHSIVVAQILTPADTILFSRNEVLGYATDSGGNTSHAALFARALKIPSVVGLKTVTTSVKSGDFIIVDGYNGEVIINPSEKTKKQVRERIQKFASFEEKLNSLKTLPATTIDGRHIMLTSNIEFPEEIDYVNAQGSEGIGLYRTEGVLMGRDSFPTEEEQYEQYRSVADKAFPHSVIMRTFDIGGDKVMSQEHVEENPFLGWRGIRLSLDRPEIFIPQINALLRASARGNVRIMLPMVSSVKEIRRAKKFIEQSKDLLRRKNIPFDESIKLGVMIEVPSAAVLAGAMAQEVDFLSIGTNDLIQYLLAVDRDNEVVSSLYQEFHPAVLRTIHHIISEAKKYNKPVGMCGEMAGDPMATLLLLGLGLDAFSVVPTVLPEIKKIIRAVSVTEAKEIADRALAMEAEEDIKEFLRINLAAIAPDIPLPEE